MNKKISSLFFTFIFSINITSLFAHNNENPFQKLTNRISNDAKKWVINEVSVLTFEDQLLLLNFFSPEEKSNEIALHYIKAIQANPKLEKSLNEAQTNINAIIEAYVKSVLDKPAAQKNIATNFEAFHEKINAKILDLVTYTGTFYYKAIYAFLMENSVPTKKLMCMFDENGLIAPEKRSITLFNPTAIQQN